MVNKIIACEKCIESYNLDKDKLPKRKKNDVCCWCNTIIREDEKSNNINITVYCKKCKNSTKPLRMTVVNNCFTIKCLNCGSEKELIDGNYYGE